MHHARGGEVCIIYSRDLQIKVNDSVQYISFEHMEDKVTCNSTVINSVAIYRPYPSTANKFNMGMFIKDFSSFMESAGVTKNLLLLGDFNVHVDDVTDYDAKRFIRLLDSCGLHQHVEGPTHVSGHTLDLLISHK